jgi:hypothetical protein
MMLSCKLSKEEEHSSMATFKYVDLRIPEARLLADLDGILWDLRRSRDYARLLISELGAPSPKLQFVEPLSIATIVTYSRAFVSGVRHSLRDSDLSVLSAEQQSTHEYLISLRNKHITHSVNAFEENFARAYYCEERVQAEGFTSIGSGGGRVASLSYSDAEAVVKLTTVLEAHIEKRIESEKETLLAIVRKLPVSEVMANGQSVFDPKDRDVVKRRKQ